MEWMLLYQMNEYNKLNSNYDKYKESFIKAIKKYLIN